jgi:hypothetical protein
MLESLEANTLKINEALYKLKDAYKYISDDEKIRLGEYIKDLDNQKKKLDWILQKLKQGYIEVAFAGLEKAGKSTFINAFVEMDILPSAHERTTFTITELRYSPESKVEVEFYSYSEFLNEVFRKMLEEIKYSNPDTVSLESFSKRDLEEHFKYLQEQDKATYALHANRTETDLKDIIRGKDKIVSLLGNEKKVFSEENIESYKKYITDKYESRAVKRVTIYTPKLENLKNIIIYDLPGFDSPTIIHSKFTVETLKKVDAIVFVRKLREPSIKGPELDIINQVKEEDGIPIKEKTFFFLNQADLVDRKEEIIEDKEKFIKELKERKLFESEDRILVGSAKAYLESISNKEDRPSYEKLKDFGVENEIKYLQQRLEDFNRRSRVPIQERRFNNIINSVIQTIQKTLEILEKNQSDFIRAASPDIHYFSDKLRTMLTRELENLQIESKQEYLQMQNRNLSQKLKQSIIGCINPPSEELVNNIKNMVSTETSTLEEKPDSFNVRLRTEFSKDIESKIRESIYMVLDEETNKVYDRVKNIFKKSIKDNLGYLKNIHNTVSSKDLDSSDLDNLIDDFIDKNNLFRTYEISSLVMRFLGDILELLVKNPLNSGDRENKLEQSRGEVYALWAFHPNFDPSLNINFVERAIRYQESLQEISASFQDFMNEIQKIAETESQNKSKKIDKDKIFEILSLINGFTPLATITQKVKGVKSIEQLKNILNNLTDVSNENIYKKVPKSYDDVLSEIKLDLENLKELVNSSIINAINPEKAFVNSTSIYVRNIINKLSKDEYLDFVKDLSQWLSSIKADGQFEEKMLISLRIRSIYMELKEILKALQGGI